MMPRMADLPGRVYRMGRLNGAAADPDEVPLASRRKQPHGALRMTILQALKAGVDNPVDIAAKYELSPSSVRDQLVVMEAKALAHRTGREVKPVSSRSKSARADEWKAGPKP